MISLKPKTSTFRTLFCSTLNSFSTSISSSPPHSQRPKVSFASSLINKFHGKTIGGAFPIEPHAVSPMKLVNEQSHPHINLPPYAKTGVVPESKDFIVLADNPLRDKMRASCKLARQILDIACDSAEVGVSTNEIDEIVHEAILKAGAYPSPLNYSKFPKSVCSSVNEVICHGIPDARKLQDGDIVSFDVSNYLLGVHGDNCGTIAIGNVDEGGKQLIAATQQALDEAIAVCAPGQCLSKIGEIIHEIADANGLSSVQKYCGHGVGEDFHGLPYVKHFRNNDFLTLREGMIFTIEPMLVEGHHASTTWNDNWTVTTLDGGRAAQFEHTILITANGHEILTVA